MLADALHVWPSNDLATSVFNVINFFPMFFGSMADESTFAANVAAMRLLQDAMLSEGLTIPALTLKGKALNTVRSRLTQVSPEADDNLLVSIALLASLQVSTSAVSSRLLTENRKVLASVKRTNGIEIIWRG